MVIEVYVAGTARAVMSDQVGIAGVTVEVDEENGPVVVVQIDNRVVQVYLRLETASLVSEEGSAGLMVNGDLPRFRSAILADAVRELANMYR